MAKSKYNVGDVVYCFREGDFDFLGTIISKADTGDEWEYDVDGAPMLFNTGKRVLIWESEIVSKEQA